MDRIDCEWLALRAGIKPGLRITTDATHAEATAARYQRLGCSVATTRGRIGPHHQYQIILYIGATPQVAAGLRAAERPLLERELSSRDQAFYTREFGQRLGYPACCIEAFTTRVLRGGGILRRGGRDRYHPDYVHVDDAQVPHPDWRLNNLLLRQHLRLVSFECCRFDCPTAGALAEQVRQLAREFSPTNAPVLEACLQRPLVISPTGSRAWVETTGQTITTATAPSEPPDGAKTPEDLTFAKQLVHATVSTLGSVQDHGDPAPRLLAFRKP